MGVRQPNLSACTSVLFKLTLDERNIPTGVDDYSFASVLVCENSAVLSKGSYYDCLYFYHSASNPLNIEQYYLGTAKLQESLGICAILAL